MRCRLAREPSDRFADGRALEAEVVRLGSSRFAESRGGIIPVVPERSARSVAILPLRAAEDLLDVADGLAEEIADTLSMSRALRVRPLGARRTRTGDQDPIAIGASLGVDVVVDGSVRRRGDHVRIAARVISVADDFQLWASHVDAPPDGLLAASDDVVRAIAAALTAELALPQRPALEAHIAELYLQGKAHLRSHWLEGNVASVIANLESALQSVPDDPRIVSLLAMALARSGLFGEPGDLERSRSLAKRAVALAPTSGEAWLALGFATHYVGAGADAAAAFARAVRHAPGHAMAR